MIKMLDLRFILGAYTAGWMVAAWLHVGKQPECAPATWEFPLVMLGFLMIPTWLGYLIGVQEK